MKLDHILLLISMIIRVAQLVLFVPIIRMAWKENIIRDKITPLRVSILIMLFLYFTSLLVMLYTTYCRYDHCYNQLNLDLLNLFSGFAGFLITIVLYFVYKRKYIDD